MHQIFINLNFFAFHWEYLNILGTRGHKKFQSKPFPKNKKLILKQDFFIPQNAFTKTSFCWRVEMSKITSTSKFQVWSLTHYFFILASRHFWISWPCLPFASGAKKYARIPQGVVYLTCKRAHFGLWKSKQRNWFIVSINACFLDTNKCIDACENTKGCNYWTVSKNGGLNGGQLRCQLRQFKGSMVKKTGFVSGSLPSACCKNR